jgi:hypothetical protein
MTQMGGTDMEWIKTQDKFPAVGDSVLFVSPQTLKGIVLRGKYNGKGMGWESDFALHYSTVTHWMPLPEPPK